VQATTQSLKGSHNQAHRGAREKAPTRARKVYITAANANDRSRQERPQKYRPRRNCLLSCCVGCDDSGNPPASHPCTPVGASPGACAQPTGPLRLWWWSARARRVGCAHARAAAGARKKKREGAGGEITAGSVGFFLDRYTRTVRLQTRFLRMLFMQGLANIYRVPRAATIINMGGSSEYGTSSGTAAMNPPAGIFV
jgi:hypothetical protein